MLRCQKCHQCYMVRNVINVTWPQYKYHQCHMATVQISSMSHGHSTNVINVTWPQMSAMLQCHSHDSNMRTSIMINSNVLNSHIPIQCKLSILEVGVSLVYSRLSLLRNMLDEWTLAINISGISIYTINRLHFYVML